MSIKKHIANILLLITALAASGQQEPLPMLEDSLAARFSKLHNAQTDSMKTVQNGHILSLMRQAMEEPGGFDYPFGKLTFIGKIYSEDEKVRLITWNVAKNDGTHSYHGFVLYREDKDEKHKHWELTDKSDEIEEPDTRHLGPDNWYGALYYDIIINETEDETYYTLLGWDGNDLFTTKKIIDVLYFNWLGNPRFGPDIFRHKKERRRRVIFEYGERVSMSMEYRDDMDMIVYDHLSPAEPAYAGQYRFYGPDLSFDAFEFYDGVWNHIEDIDITISKEESKKRIEETERKLQENKEEQDKITGPFDPGTKPKGTGENGNN